MELVRVNVLADGSARLTVRVNEVERRALSALAGGDVCGPTRRMLSLSQVLDLLTPHSALYRPRFPAAHQGCTLVLYARPEEVESYLSLCRDRGMEDPSSCFKYLVDVVSAFLGAYYTVSMGVVALRG